MKTIQEVDAPLTIGQMVANNFKTADVFKKYNIDFCCKGNRTLQEVCQEKKLDIAAIEQELEVKNAVSSCAAINPKEMPLDVLVDHIVNRHHSYVRESITPLMSYLTKIAKVHGANHPEIHEILGLFTACAEELTHHMVKEENILFPAIKKLAEGQRLNKTYDKLFFFGSLANPIGGMQAEHVAEGERAQRMTELSSNFTPPADGCTTYKVAYQKLEEFINDLYVHIHLENNILFPKAIELEGHLIHVSGI